MNKKIFFNIVIQLLTFIRYGLIALTGLIMLALLILLIGGKPIQNSLQLDVPFPIIVYYSNHKYPIGSLLYLHGHHTQKIAHQLSNRNYFLN